MGVLWSMSTLAYDLFRVIRTKKLVLHCLEFFVLRDFFAVLGHWCIDIFEIPSDFVGWPMIFLSFECHLCLIFWLLWSSSHLWLLVVSPLTPELLSKKYDMCDTCCMCTSGYVCLVTSLLLVTSMLVPDDVDRWSMFDRVDQFWDRRFSDIDHKNIFWRSSKKSDMCLVVNVDIDMWPVSGHLDRFFVASLSRNFRASWFFCCFGSLIHRYHRDSWWLRWLTDDLSIFWVSSVSYFFVLCCMLSASIVSCFTLNTRSSLKEQRCMCHMCDVYN